jgi:predicted transcriptional regulator
MSAVTSITPDQAREVAAAIGIKWDEVKFDLDQFRRGMLVELEHGLRDPQTNVTNDDLVLTGKIAWAHLKEIANYYDLLEAMERSAGS